MFGNESDEGLVFLILKHALLRDYSKVSLSIIEIYKEHMKDLTTNDTIKFKCVDKGQFTNLNEINIVSIDQAVSYVQSTFIFRIVREAASKRQQGPTDLNATSSRSHLIVRIRAISKDKASEPSEILIADFAGSESSKSANTTGDSQKAGNAINSSLLGLKLVMDALYKKESHVPYRNYTLTQVLQPFLKDGYFSVISHVDPTHFGDAKQAFEFAGVCSEIKRKTVKKGKFGECNLFFRG